MKVTTLKSRIIVLLIIFTIVTIGTFVAVQLFHELSITTQHNIYRANITSLLIEEQISKISESTLPEDRKINAMKQTLNSLKNAQLINRAYMLNEGGTVVSSTEEWLIGGKGDSFDLRILDMVNKGDLVERETAIDKTLRSLSLYLPMEDNAGMRLIIRVFFSLGNIWAILPQVYQPVMLIGAALILINVLLGVFFSQLVIDPIRVFNEAAKTIASGHLSSRVNIATNDELEELADTFNFMTKELVKMKDKAENANPLTKLPGNIVIMNDIESKIGKGKKFTIIYCDLDNFKAFNDKYGIGKGDEAIKLTGDIFKEAISKKGGASDFIGHEGGDDFILITTPEKAEDITDYIIAEFDKMTPSLYNKEDLNRGYIVAQSRDGVVKRFPIMTISLAGVTNEHRDINSYAEITNIAAEVKKKAKEENKSNFVLDKRKN